MARILNLGYPGGPIIDRLARRGINREIRFPCAQLPGTDDFSFSGIKTAVLYFIRKQKNKNNLPVDKIAYAFQDSVVSVLAEKCIAVCKRKHVRTLLVGGGVAANSALRQRLFQRAGEERIDVFFPAMSLCLDNAAMIAGLGYHLTKNRQNEFGIRRPF